MSVVTVYSRLPRVVPYGKRSKFDLYLIELRRRGVNSRSCLAWIDDSDRLNIITPVRKQPVSPPVYREIADRVRAAIDQFVEDRS